MAKVRGLIVEFKEGEPFYQSLFTGYNKQYIPFVSAHYDIGLNTTGVLRYFDLMRYASDYLDVFIFRENRLVESELGEKVCIRIHAFGEETKVQLFINFITNAVKAVEHDAAEEGRQSGENITHIRTRLAGIIFQSVLTARDRKRRLPFKAYDRKNYLKDLKYAADQLGIGKGKQRLKAGYGRG